MPLYDVKGSGKFKTGQVPFIITGFAMIDDIPISGIIGQPGVKFKIVNFSISAATTDQIHTFIKDKESAEISYIEMGNLDDYLHLNGKLDWNKWYFDQQRKSTYRLVDTMNYGNDSMTMDPANIEINELIFTRHMNKTDGNRPATPAE